MSSNTSQLTPQQQQQQQQALLDHFQHVQQVDEKIFLGIQIAGGHILLPILVLTIIFSRKVTRHPVFVNFCVSWIFSSVVYSLLVYKGRSSGDLFSLNPSYDSCLIQASLLNGVQALTVSTNLALVVHLWIILRSFAKSKTDPSPRGNEKSGLLYVCSLLGIPFAVFLVFTLYSVVAGSTLAIDGKTDKLIPSSNLSVPGVFYCIILFNSNFTSSIIPGLGLVRATYVFSAVISLVTICFEGLVARLILRQRAELRKISRSWIFTFLRIFLFSIYRVLSVCLNLAVILHPDELLLVGIAKSNLFNGVIDYVQAAIPLVAFLVFATEKDVLNVWCFWKKGNTQKGESKENLVGVKGSADGISQ